VPPKKPKSSKSLKAKLKKASGKAFVQSNLTKVKKVVGQALKGCVGEPASLADLKAIIQTAIPTGFPEFDGVFGGGFDATNLPPGVGIADDFHHVECNAELVKNLSLKPGVHVTETDVSELDPDVAQAIAAWKKHVAKHWSKGKHKKLLSSSEAVKADEAYFHEKLKAGAQEIYSNTLKGQDNFLHFNAKQLQAVANALKIPVELISDFVTESGGSITKGALVGHLSDFVTEEMLDAAAGVVTSKLTVAPTEQAYLMLADATTDHITLSLLEDQVKNTPVPDALLTGCGSYVHTAGKVAQVHYDLMVHALGETSLKDFVEFVPKRYDGEIAEDYRDRLASWWIAVHKSFPMLAAKARAIGVEPKGYKAGEVVGLKHLAPGYVNVPWSPEFAYATPPDVFNEAMEREKWAVACAEFVMDTAFGFMDTLSKSAFYAAHILINAKIASDFDDLDTASPEDYEKFKARMVFRIAAKLRVALEQTYGNFDSGMESDFNTVFPLKATKVIKTTEELIKVFGEPDKNKDVHAPAIASIISGQLMGFKADAFMGVHIPPAHQPMSISSKATLSPEALATLKRFGVTPKDSE
jgi:hypothetical protein